MCGIVRKPTRKSSFPIPKSFFQNLSAGTIDTILDVCEETHIPEDATQAVLLLADKAAGIKDFLFLAVPFAIYQDGKRYVTKETMEIESSVMHLAMAGSTRHYINQALSVYGIKLELGHCCDIQMHGLNYSEEVMVRSHDINVYRADRLRELGENSEHSIDLLDFLEKINDNMIQEIAEKMFLTSQVFAK